MSGTKKSKVSKTLTAKSPAKAQASARSKSGASAVVRAAAAKSGTAKPAPAPVRAPKSSQKPIQKTAPVPGKSVRKGSGAKSAVEAASKPKIPSKAGSFQRSDIALPIKTPTASAAAQQRPQSRAAQQKPDKKLTARTPAAPVVLTPDYRPSEKEPFMNEKHRAYFRQRLLTWKEEIIRQTKETLVILHEDSVQHADIADRATSETDRSLELRARDRQRKLIAKIDAALARIDDGSYGYCEETGEPIGLKRLDARPIATLSLEAQERHERREKVYRED